MQAENHDTNMQKYSNYKEQFSRLYKAIKNEYYMEAVFIEYSIMEDRTRAILKRAGKYEAYLKKRGRYQETLDSKIKYIQCFAAEKKSLLNRYFGDDLLMKILEWKEQRNALVHALLDQKLHTEDIASFALTGMEYVKDIRNRATNYRRAVEKEETKSTV